MGDTGMRRPKGYIEVGTMPIIEQSILRLRASRIRRIVIVTGHMARCYERLQGQYADLIQLVHNDRYADLGSMYSLFIARKEIDDSFLLLESDLIYEQRALSVLINDEAPNVLLVSGRTGAGDEYYVEATGGFLKNASKDRSVLGAVVGEWVGIAKLSAIFLGRMVQHAEGIFQNRLAVDYEDSLVAAASNIPVRCKLIEDLAWSEIDNEAQLTRARDSIYPLILSRDGLA
jgi:choline kinase